MRSMTSWKFQSKSKTIRVKCSDKDPWGAQKDHPHVTQTDVFGGELKAGKLFWAKWA